MNITGAERTSYTALNLEVSSALEREALPELTQEPQSDISEESFPYGHYATIKEENLSSKYKIYFIERNKLRSRIISMLNIETFLSIIWTLSSTMCLYF